MSIATLKRYTRITRIITSLLLLVPLSATASALTDNYKRYYGSRLSNALETNGLGTLKLALDITELTSVLDHNRVTVFAPTDDVFEATAQALGCKDAMDLATRLSVIPVGDSDALTSVLTYHAVFGKIRSEFSLLNASHIKTVNGEELTTGVNSKGLYVQGISNATPSSITVNGIRSYRWVIYPIDSILLPFAPPADLCA